MKPPSITINVKRSLLTLLSFQQWARQLPHSFAPLRFLTAPGHRLGCDGDVVQQVDRTNQGIAIAPDALRLAIDYDSELRRPLLCSLPLIDCPIVGLHHGI